VGFNLVVMVLKGVVEELEEVIAAVGPNPVIEIFPSA
jgi:hypothetical protein